MFMSVLTLLPVHASGYTEHAARIENQVRYPSSAPDSLDALVSGWLYQYQSVQNGYPYFGDQNWVKSTVSTKYESFRNVLVKYDIYQDALIMPLYRKDGTFPVVLNSQEVMSFTLNAYTFINLDNLTADCSHTYTGYYELIFDGRLKLVAKWQKLMSDEDKMGGGKFDLVRTLFLIRDNNLYKLRRNSSLLKLFPDQKQAIRKYIREKQIYIDRSDDNRLKDLIKYIDQLTD